MEYNPHGGNCCGYGHIYGFDSATEEDFNACFREHLDAGRGHNRICEVILSERQITPVHGDQRIFESVREVGGWPAILARKGFRLTARWNNSNTDRKCYQFLWLPDQASFLSLTQIPANLSRYFMLGDADNLVPNPAEIPAPRPERRVVFTEYFAETRTVGRRGPYNTLVEAQEAWPRCRNFSRREIWNDGQIVETEYWR